MNLLGFETEGFQKPTLLNDEMLGKKKKKGKFGLMYCKLP